MTKLAHQQEANNLPSLQNAKQPKKLGRNDPCSCGSGKKFKKCCLDNVSHHDHAHHEHHHCDHC